MLLSAIAVPALLATSVVYDFDFLANEGKNVKTLTVDELATHYPALSGEYLRIPTNSIGLLQLSIGRMRGRLFYRGHYANRTLTIRARRYPHPKETSAIPFGWALNGVTNTFAVIAITNYFTESTIDLSSVPEGATLIVNQDTRKGYRRVIIDEITICEKEGMKILLK